MSKTQVSPSQLTRRHFIKSSSLFAGGAVLGAPYIMRSAESPNAKLNIGIIGAGGKGKEDSENMAGENVVALCDIDQKRLDERAQKFPKAKLYRDYRKMIEEMKEIDAVTVSTPDHHHAPASVMAMKLGKHVYCQKPLTHSVYEARLMRDTARKYKVATQMGNQGSAESGLRRAIEVVQSGAIGPVREVHVWSNRPIWPQGMARPKDTPSVPENLSWDLFLGPAPERPYHPDYQPFKWRGWVDFGTGALGDMACHTANMPFRALKLGYPVSVAAESSGFNGESYPKSSKIRFEFPRRSAGQHPPVEIASALARSESAFGSGPDGKGVFRLSGQGLSSADSLPPVSFCWYDGGSKPSDDIAELVLNHITTQKDKNGAPNARKLPGSGCLLMGDKGQLFSPDDYGAKFFLLPGTEFVDYQGPEQTIPRSIGHYKEWIEACKGGKPAFSNFDIAAYLTEIILLGCVALRAGKKIEWDGPNMRATNAPEVAQFVKREYRKGWTV
jgi:predicted dehydrogenase